MLAHSRLARAPVAIGRRIAPAFLSAATVLAIGFVPSLAREIAEAPPWPGDLSASGLIAASRSDPAAVQPYASRALRVAVEDFVRRARLRSGPSSVRARSAPRQPAVGLANVRVNDPTPDDVGETQAEVSLAVHGDTVVVGWNDCAGLIPGNTVTSYGYSTDGGASFTDGGNVPLALATDFPFGQTGLDTDEQGNWYLCSVYQREAGAPGPTFEQDIAVFRGRFDESGQLVWELPVMASIGTGSTGRLDRGLIGCDRLSGNVYVSYTRFLSTPRIEIVRSTTQGADWDLPIMLDSDAVGSAMGPSKQGARPVCGPDGEVYVVWSKGANRIGCPDHGPEAVYDVKGQVAFSRSLDFGQTFSPKKAIGVVEMTWTWSGPGDVRERGNDFPDIAVDRSNGPSRGAIYVTWNESAPWSSNLGVGIPRAEADDSANTDPNSPDPFVIGEDVNGAILDPYDEDYWRFHAEQGQNLFFNIDPRGFECGLSGASVAVGMEIWAMQDTFPTAFGEVPDSLLAASTLGLFADRIVWTAPRSGDYLLDVYGTFGLLPLNYRLRARPLVFGAPSPARDARDIVLVHSGDQGATWSPEQRINDDPPGLENRRPSVAVDGLGHAHVFWYDSRNPGLGTNAALVHLFGATSRDGGATWTPDYQVSDEASFFSFNTLCAPNMGDYNHSAGSGDRAFAGWSDQRLSSGDVRNPIPPPRYFAGFGPDVYTQRVQFGFAPACAGAESARAGEPVERQFCVTNTGTIADSYHYRAVDSRGWLENTVEGTLGPVAPGETACVTARLLLPGDCTSEGEDSLTFTAEPQGVVGESLVCGASLVCDPGVPALVAGFGARSLGDAVELSWTSFAVSQVRSWKAYRSASREEGYALVQADPIPMGEGGDFRLVDRPGVTGVLYYRLDAVLASGREVMVEIMAVTLGSNPALFSFRFAGPNPFLETTSFTYALPERAPVRIDVFSTAGRKLATLTNRVQEAGVYTLPFSPRDLFGGPAAGVYQVRIAAGRHVSTLQAIAVR